MRCRKTAAGASWFRCGATPTKSSSSSPITAPACAIPNVYSTPSTPLSQSAKALVWDSAQLTELSRITKDRSPATTVPRAELHSKSACLPSRLAHRSLKRRTPERLRRAERWASPPGWTGETPLPPFPLPSAGQDRIRHSRCLGCDPHVVRAQNVGSLQDQHCLRRQSAIQPFSNGSVFVIPRQRSPNKRFARHSRQQGKSDLLQLREARQQRVVLLEVLSEAKARIEHHAIALHPCQRCRLRPLPQFPLDQQHRIANRRQRSPLLRPPPRVHEHRTDLELGQCLGHLRIPAKTADVVHDFRPRFDRPACHARLVGVDAHDRLWPSPLQFPDHRQHALPLFFFRYWRSHPRRAPESHPRPRPRGLSAHVDDGGAVRDQLLGTRDGLLRIKVQPAIGEGIRRYIYDAHDQGSPPEFENSRTHVPLEDSAH